jgi:pyruvate ferredoxin oxidoreductase beta subunit
VEDYLKLQRRYAHLFGEEPQTEVVGRIQAIADRNIGRFGLLASGEEGADLPGDAGDTAGRPEGAPR